MLLPPPSSSAPLLPRPSLLFHRVSASSPISYLSDGQPRHLTSLAHLQKEVPPNCPSWQSPTVLSCPLPASIFATHFPLTHVPDNPFARRSQFGHHSLLAYKALTIITWLLVVVTALFYDFNSPEDCKHKGDHFCRTIWGQNKHVPTPFSLDATVTSIYWLILLVMQGGYIWHLFSANEHFVTCAANVGSHFIIVRHALGVTLTPNCFVLADILRRTISSPSASSCSGSVVGSGWPSSCWSSTSSTKQPSTSATTTPRASCTSLSSAGPTPGHTWRCSGMGPLWSMPPALQRESLLISSSGLFCCLEASSSLPSRITQLGLN